MIVITPVVVHQVGSLLIVVDRSRSRSGRGTRERGVILSLGVELSSRALVDQEMNSTCNVALLACNNNLGLTRYNEQTRVNCESTFHLHEAPRPPRAATTSGRWSSGHPSHLITGHGNDYELDCDSGLETVDWRVAENLRAVAYAGTGRPGLSEVDRSNRLTTVHMAASAKVELQSLLERVHNCHGF